jgi:beta-fructofuranosidase
MPFSRRTFVSLGLAATGESLVRRGRLFASPLASVPAASLAADPRRPQFHLLPTANWMNDPNGPIYWRGHYHMFCQYNPNAAVWGDMHWAHAISPDMLHWRHLPIALAPQPHGADAAGCFTGTAIRDGNRVVVLYTGVTDTAPPGSSPGFKESQCIAIASDPDLTNWTQDPDPVIAAPPSGLDVTGFRDPTPWREGDTWYLAVGSGMRGQGGAVLLYRSADLRHWEYLHLLAHGTPSSSSDHDPVASGDMWECPDFFPLGDKHVLIYSTQGKTFWHSGTLDSAAMLFHSERSGILDHGSFYAPKTQLDRLGRRILWGWIPEARPVAEYRAAGWAGLMSLPRVLTLDNNNDLRVALLPKFDQLRTDRRELHFTGDDARDRQQLAAMSIGDACGEIVISFREGSEPLQFALVAAQNPATSWLTCSYDPSSPGHISIDDHPLPLGAGDSAASIELRFVIDGSVIECFANNSSTLTKRFYYPGATAPAIGIELKGSLKNLTRLSIAQVAPISANRLTT